MRFAAPIWLALLLPPWGALAVWLVWTRHADGARVPFLELWRGSVAPARAAGRLRLPPLALLALIVAVLLAVLAAAKPVATRPAAPAPRVVTTAPEPAPAKQRAKVAIAHVAAVDRPRPQVMVTVRNDSSDQSSARLEIRSRGPSLRRDIALPPRGREANFFIDLPAAAADRIDVTLGARDEIGSIERASLVRRSATPRVEVRGGDVPPEVRRVVEAYARARPAGIGAPIVACPPGNGEAGVIIAPPGAKGDLIAAAPRDVRVVAHAVTADIVFAKVPMSIGSGASPLGAGGWTTLVSVQDKPVVAVRESPARQVWIGFSSAEFARTSWFVVLWTNAIDWVAGRGDQEFAASVAPRGQEQEDAVKPQAGDAPAPAAAARRDLELAGPLAFSSLLCVFFASLTWSSGRRLTAFSAPRTVS